MIELPTSDQLLAELRDRGIKGKDIADLLGIAPSAVTALYKGKRQLKLDEAIKLMHWIGGVEARSLPLIDMKKASRWKDAMELSVASISMPKEIDAPGTFTVTVVDDMMADVLPEGAFAIVDVEQTELFSGNAYLLVNEGDEGVIMMYQNDPARFEPRSSNPKHAPIRLGSASVQVIGRVTGALRKF